MKKRFLAIIMIIALAVILSATIVACGNKIEYSVTVQLPDKKTAVPNVTVNWISGDKVAATAKTDANGKATAMLDAGTYKIELADYGEEYGYTSVSLSSQMNTTTIRLSVKQINYTVTVKDKDGSPANNVDVTFMSGSSIAGTTKTGENGKAEIELAYGDYTVTVSNLPEGNLSDGNKTVTGANPSAEFNLRDGSNVEFKTYKITVKSEGGLIFKNQAVIIEDSNGDILVANKTDENGEYTFSYEASNYTVIVDDVPQGYSSARAALTADAAEIEIKLHSEIIKTDPDRDTTYVIGDIFHDYSFSTPYNMEDGKPWSGSIAEILKTKKAIVLNNWGTSCTYCVQEMPAMQSLYEAYSDQIEIIAVSNYPSPFDTDAIIVNHQASNGYTFPMMRDTNGFTAKFGITGWPYTVIIDRYGAIARIESGAIPSHEAWEYMIKMYIGDDYVQTFEPGNKVSKPIVEEIARPDITVPEDHYEQIGEALNMTSTFNGASVTWSGAVNDEMAWPFLVGTVDGISPEEKVIYASNVGKGSSYAIIYATVDVTAGRIFAFDYYIDNEQSDIFSLFWDGKVVREISGNNSGRGWQTCYFYVDITDGEHTFAILYRKDSSSNEGLDNMYLRRVRFVDDLSVLSEQPTDMLRNAAYGALNDGDTRFPYYANVEIGSDGYYHVVLDNLQNSQYAGVDNSPLLFVNFTTPTHWNNLYSLNALITGVNESGEKAFGCIFNIDGVTRDYRNDLIEYASAATASDLPGFVPVNKFLHDMLVAFMPQVSGGRSHENEWLEACYFYSHYGDGEFIGNPIIGLMPETAIEITTDQTYTVDLTRNMYPFPTVIYAFTPATDGLYKFESFIPDKDSSRLNAQIWLYDDYTDPDSALAYSGEYRISITATNEQNFELYYTLEAGHKYYIELALLMSETGSYDFKITRQAEDVTILEPTSADVFQAILDENDKIIGTILIGAVEYMKDADGYLHVKNADGTMGEFIYLDVLNANTSALGTIPLTRLVDKFVQDPLIGSDGKIKDLDYKFFDFRYCVMYFKETDANGDEINTRLAKVDISDNPKYKDYTATMKAYVDSAPTEGKYKGLIKVDQELVDILTMFLELRVNGVWAEEKGGEITKWETDALENEWLRFCWYFHTYKAVPENE